MELQNKLLESKINMSFKEDQTEKATIRSSMYGFLSSMFREEITAVRLGQIMAPPMKDVLSEMGVQLDDFDRKDHHELLEDLAVEYTRLFLGPGKHISPHESVHHKRDDGDWGMLWGASTVEVKKFIETSGLSYKKEFTGLPDHISVELEFMQLAARREAQSLEENDWEGALYCQKMEMKFICDHLIKWIPSFCEKVISQSNLSFYRDLAHVMKNFITFEYEEIILSLTEPDVAM